ncbi:MAG TPA: cyanophycinase, partial [Acidobacteriota bacterium]|nr:cyanophycinase [Acidobacteriota bacterium]
MKSFRLWPVVAIFWFSVCCLMLAASPCVLAGERLVLVGGGKRPVQAVARFVDWAGGSEARIVIIPWASGEPQESYDALAKEINEHHPAAVECAPFAPLTAESKARFLAQLKTAGGVFFTGGDQSRIMDVLADATLLAELRHRYTEGTVFGGTSAGTAIMSRIMLTGDGDFEVIDGGKVVTREGLGLLPNTIVDQH